MTSASQTLALFGAGLLGGALNAVAGGGSLVTFPALLAAGVPPVPANATNTLASLPGYLTSLWAYRGALGAHRALLGRIALVSLLGGLLGAGLLIVLPAEAFSGAVPWLLLVATLLFGFGPWLTRAARRARLPEGVHDGLQFAVAVYGGFFNAGLGILSLGALAARGLTDISAMNGLKMVVSSLVSVAAVAAFLLGGLIAWEAGLAVIAGTALGGYGMARLALRLPMDLLRSAILVYAAGLTAYWFWRVHGPPG
ncbi:MAG: sulfite exporter TauE/SafE family protein [Alphaproteobacteria bacterium]|nr:sulfite exporter TauE/SafE family protein [Alphaproteobacteria bacterium]